MPCVHRMELVAFFFYHFVMATAFSVLLFYFMVCGISVTLHATICVRCSQRSVFIYISIFEIRICNDHVIIALLNVKMAMKSHNFPICKCHSVKIAKYRFEMGITLHFVLVHLSTSFIVFIIFLALLILMEKGRAQQSHPAISTGPNAIHVFFFFLFFGEYWIHFLSYFLLATASFHCFIFSIFHYIITIIIRAI